MRNKKLIFVATLILTISILLCVFVGCQKKATPAEILLSFYDEEAKPTVKSQELTNLKDYTISQMEDEWIVATKNDDGKTTYALFNIAENKIIATSENYFIRAISGVFYTSKVVDDEMTYTYYSKDGVVKQSVKDRASASGYALTFADGTVVVSTKSGIVTLEQNLENVTNMANNYLGATVIENGDFFIICPQYSDIYVIYNKDGKFLYSINVDAFINATAEDDVYVYNLGKGKVAIQVTRALTEIEAKEGFDFVMLDDGAEFYLSLTTYMADLATKELKEIEFDKLIVDVEYNSKDEDYALLSVQDIYSKHVASNKTLIVTDTALNVKVQLNDFVNNAKYFGVIDETTFAVMDDVMAYIYNNKGELVNSYAMNVPFTGAGLIKVGRYFYDVKGNEVFKTEENMFLLMDEDDGIMTDGLIYYVKEDDEETLYAFDSNTKTKLTYDAKDIEMLDSQNHSFFTVGDADGNLTIYSMYTGKAISTNKFASVDTTTSGDYTIITAIDADGNITYFSYTIE